MNLERTPLLIEARGQTRHGINRAADVSRSRTAYHHKKKKKKHHKKVKQPFSLVARELDYPRTIPGLGMTIAGPGSFGPVSVGGIMRHS